MPRPQHKNDEGVSRLLNVPMVPSLHLGNVSEFGILSHGRVSRRLQNGMDWADGSD